MMAAVKKYSKDARQIPAGTVEFFRKLYKNEIDRRTSKIFRRIKFVRRKATTGKLSVPNFDELKEIFITRIKGVMKKNRIPDCLVFNLDETGLNITNYTME